MSKPVYLDYNATTPPAAEVIRAMADSLEHAWGNPSSAHAFGHEARQEVQRAREQVACLLGAHPDEIVFTAGGTESDNAAIIGVAEATVERGRHIVTSAVEHAAVGKACDYLESRGWSVTRVAVDSDGRVDADRFNAAVRDDTVLVSLMHANNETGVLQPVRRVADGARARGCMVHTDAAQSVGKVGVTVDGLGVDLLTLAGHKLYGPKGVGALYVRRGTPLSSFLRGAPHESGRRAGTENVAGITGLGTACELARKELPRRTRHLEGLRDRLEQALRAAIPDLVIHGESVDRLPNTTYAAIPGVEAHRLLELAPEIAAGSGAACHSGQTHVSAVLAAMNVPQELAVATLRLTVGCPTTEEEIDVAVLKITEAARRLRGMAHPS